MSDFVSKGWLLSKSSLPDPLSPGEKQHRLRVMRRLGQEAAAYIEEVLPEALGRYRHVILGIHFPPFEEACWYLGKISAPEWLPHLGCKAVGDMLRRVMNAHPGRKLTVLCGHTHGQGTARILPNLLVYTGGARYAHPSLQRVFELD